MPCEASCRHLGWFTFMSCRCYSSAELHKSAACPCIPSMCPCIRFLLLLCSPLDELKRLLDRCAQVNAALDKTDQAAASSSLQAGGQGLSDAVQRGAGADVQGSDLPAASGMPFAILA